MVSLVKSYRISSERRSVESAPVFLKQNNHSSKGSVVLRDTLFKSPEPSQHSPSFRTEVRSPVVPLDLQRVGPPVEARPHK